MWYMHEGSGWWMLFGGIWMILFWGGLIGFAVWWVNKLSRQNGTTGKISPLDIARERYAKGEISKEEFEQIKKDL